MVISPVWWSESERCHPVHGRSPCLLTWVPLQEPNTLACQTYPWVGRQWCRQKEVNHYYYGWISRFWSSSLASFNQAFSTGTTRQAAHRWSSRYREMDLAINDLISVHAVRLPCHEWSPARLAASTMIRFNDSGWSSLHSMTMNFPVYTARMQYQKQPAIVRYRLLI